MKIYKDEQLVGEVLNIEAFLQDSGYSKDEIIIVYSEKELKIQITNYIYQHYPQTKQNSDLADKLYYENVLKAGGFENLEQIVVKKVLEFENGKNLDELLEDVASENKTAMKQLLKVGIRVAWVQKCKAELKKAIAEDREPNYPKYPL